MLNPKFWVLIICIVIVLPGCKSNDIQTTTTPVYETYPSQFYQQRFDALVGVVPTGANAPTQLEGEALQRFVDELDILLSIINEAERHQRPEQRLPFKYDKLKEDIAALKAGVLKYLQTKSTAPRAAKNDVFEGDYR